MRATLSLTKDPIPNLIKRIAIPASVGTFFQTMFNIVDVYFAGRISPEALSALAKSFPIYFIIIAACVGVTVGGTSLIANSIGEENKEKVLGFFCTNNNLWNYSICNNNSIWSYFCTKSFFLNGICGSSALTKS